MKHHFSWCARLGCIVLALAATQAHAKLWLTQKQVLPADGIYDLVVWHADTSDGSAKRWACDSLQGEDLQPATCQSHPYAKPTAGARDEYIYSAFLNAAPDARRAELSAKGPAQEAAFDSLSSPVLAIKERGDSCVYLVIFRDSYAPLALGRIACADTRSALREVSRDLAGRKKMVPRPGRSAAAKRAGGGDELSDLTTDRLDYGLEASAGAAIGMSDDKTENEGTPFEQEVQHFDFNDFAELDQVPLGIRAYLSWNGAIGFRAGYAYSTYTLASRIYSGFQADIAAQGGELQAWKIARHDYTFELLFGKMKSNSNADMGAHGILGVIKTDFKETAKISGKEYHNGGILKDETGVILGAGGDILIARHVLFGFEVGLLLKDFALQGTGTQPDGTGNEIQIRFRLGAFERMEWGPKDR